MERMLSNRPPSLTTSDISGTDLGILYESTEDDIEINTPTYSLSMMDPIEAAMKPENMLEQF
ncbi:10065_t:CDS:1, partial [Paraglomus occultum]